MSLVSGLDYRSKVISELILSLFKFEEKVAEFVSHPDETEIVSLLERQIKSASVTLQMIELRGAVLLSQELEKLLHSIKLNTVRDKSDAATVLVQASEKFLEYLQYIRNGSADIPLALLPVLNDMRAVQNARLLSEAILLLPDFATTSRSKPGSLPKEIEKCFKDEVKYVRAPLMRALLNWYHGKDCESSLNEIYTLFDGLYRVSSGADLSRLWRVVLAIIESLTDDGLQANAAIKSMFAQLERFLHGLMELKLQAIYQSIPLELFKNLLYYIALSSSTSKKVLQIKSSYQLQEILPSKLSRDKALHALDGPGIDMLQTVGNATREELALIKDSIEVFVHADKPDMDEMERLPGRMATLTSTLEMLGMYTAAAQNNTVIEQLKMLDSEDDINHSQLLSIASNMLRIDVAVDEFVHSREQLGVYQELASEPLGEHNLSSQQYDELLASLLTESLRALERVKDLYLPDINTNIDRERFKKISHILEESASVLQILPMPELALLFNGLGGYTTQLSNSAEHKLSQESHQYFADVVSCLEVYIDLQIQRQSSVVDLLGHSADALELLINSSDESQGRVSAKKTQPDDSENLAEPEMIEIFTEEAIQQFNQMSIYMNNLRADKNDFKALEMIRRSYHTLKGSGRVVGAKEISEFSWANEYLLNKVLMRNAHLSNAIFEHLEESLVALPQLVDQIDGATEQVDGIQLLVQRATELANSEESIEKESVLTQPTLADIEGSDTEDTEIDITDMTQTLDITGVVESADTLQLPPMDQVDTIEIEAPVKGKHTDVEQSSADLVEKDSQVLQPGDTVVTGMDPALLEIFTKECALHISNLKSIFNQALEGEASTEASEEMVRAFHTLTGSAQTAHASSIAAFLAPIESAIKRKQRARSRFSRGETFFLSETVNALEQKLQALADGVDEPRSVQDIQVRLAGFIDRINAETEGVAEPPGFGELQSVFIEEAQDIVEQLQRLVSKWKKNTRDLECVREMQSGLHTLKGSARVASYSGIADLAHAIEDALQRWSVAPSNPNIDALDALSDAMDALSINVEQAQAGEEPGYFDWLISELGNASTEFSVSVEEDINTLPTSATSVAEESNKVTGSLEEENIQTVSHDRVRLDTSTIDRLSNLNSESSVYLSQASQHHSRLTESLTELDQTVKRLRSQLRELDLESELFVAVDKGVTAESSFDPLELDRYSNLQTLSRAILESFSDLDDIRYSFGVDLRNADMELVEQRRISNTTQDILTQIRMVRFKSIEARLQSTFEQTSKSVGKRAMLQIEGTEFAVDQSVLKPITASLEHLLRNSVAHGIEFPAARKAQNKPEQGLVELRFWVVEGDVFVSLTDDGAGIDTNAVRELAVEQGQLSAESSLSNQLLLKLLSESGFSTDATVDQISGRGVGLDAVQRELKKIGGILTLQTEAKVGSSFVIKVPQPSFLNQLLIIGVAGRQMALSANVVQGVTRMPISKLKEQEGGQENIVEYQGNAYRVIWLNELMHLPRDESNHSISLIFIDHGKENLAIVADSISSHVEVIVKPVGRQLSLTERYSGAAVQSDGAVIPILDLATWSAASLERYPIDSIVQSITPDWRAKILVIDDSITMRKYAQKALLQDSYIAEFARDGVDAMRTIKNNKPDLIITDLEMPRMDGFELIDMLKDDNELSDIPVIVITSRTGEKHLEYLQAKGINNCLAKPYQEKQLLTLIKQLLAS